MKTSLFACSLLCTLFSACNNPQLNTLSETEAEGVKAVAMTFVSSVRYKITYTASTVDDKTNVFTLIIDSLSATMKPFKEHAFMLSSNAAYLLYKNLTEEERHRFTHVHIVLPNDNTEGIDTYKYPVNLLDTLVGKTTLIEKVLSCIEKEDYNGIISLQYPPVKPSVQKKFLQTTKEIESKYGDMRSILPLGFQFYQPEGESMFVRFFGIIYKSNINLAFSVDFYLDTQMETIIGFRFSHKF